MAKISGVATLGSARAAQRPIHTSGKPLTIGCSMLTRSFGYSKVYKYKTKIFFVSMSISLSACSMRGAVSSRAAPIPSGSLIRASGRAVRRPNRGTVKGSAAVNPNAAPAAAPAAAPVISRRRAASTLAIGAAALALLPCTLTTTHAAAAAAAAEPGLQLKPAAAEDTSTDPAGSEMTLYVVPAGGSEKASPGPSFRSISEAVSAAAPGARILIAAGSYRERLILSRPVSLEAFPEVADGMDLGKSVWCLGYVV